MVCLLTVRAYLILIHLILLWSLFLILLMALWTFVWMLLMELWKFVVILLMELWKFVVMLPTVVLILVLLVILLFLLPVGYTVGCFGCLFANLVDSIVLLQVVVALLLAFLVLLQVPCFEVVLFCLLPCPVCGLLRMDTHLLMNMSHLLSTANMFRSLYFLLVRPLLPLVSLVLLLQLLVLFVSVVVALIDRILCS